ncbi:MAG: TIGR00730 family Rossman fold protein [Bacteroidaceae bacterium]|nr:TIGR00730 family Rossman fold protein [Bacteroidaceae bacterium]
MNNIETVCVYCASSTKIGKKYFDVARELGAKLAGEGIELINGAGSLGLMCACSDACLEAGGRVTGVIPQFMVDMGWGHTGLTRTIVTPDMHIRKQTMADKSDGVIALPGGVGTLEELLEIITWKQLGIYLNPIVILNVDGYFDPLLAMLDKAVEENFMRSEHAAIWSVATTVDEAISQLRQTPVWDASVRKNAAI